MIRAANKIGAADSRHVGQSWRCWFLFVTIAFRGHSPAAVADLLRQASQHHAQP
ncbi:MAG: hypothetical protein JWR69_2647 [Pedosphaera sp.]|nr:hypothetical protein [Pedosphaera sp.]